MKSNLLAAIVDAISHLATDRRNTPNMVQTLEPHPADKTAGGEERRYLCECEAYFWMPATGPWYF